MTLSPQALPAATAPQFASFRLGLAREAVRAWQTTMLAVAIVALALDTILPLLGKTFILMPWGHGPHPVIIASATMALLARSVLCAIAWDRDFERIYPRMAPALVLVAHVGAAVAFSLPIFSFRMGYVALASLQIFAASILSGLRFHQSTGVNAASVAGLAFGAWLLDVPVATAAPFVGAMLLCCVMSGIAAMALESSRRALFIEHSRVSDLAVLDGLTGLKNRYAFDNHLLHTWQAAAQGKRTLTVLLVDVDFFKTYNDTRGHVAGDRALQHIARVVQGLAQRPLDFVARYGGDEIAVVLLDATAESVIALATRMHDAVSELGLTWRESGETRRVTLSIGVAHLRPAAGSTPLLAVQVADQALYAAKRAGRNRFALLDEVADTEATGVFEPGRLRQSA